MVYKNRMPLSCLLCNSPIVAPTGKKEFRALKQASGAACRQFGILLLRLLIVRPHEPSSLGHRAGEHGRQRKKQAQMSTSPREDGIEARRGLEARRGFETSLIVCRGRSELIISHCYNSGREALMMYEGGRGSGVRPRAAG